LGYEPVDLPLLQIRAITVGIRAWPLILRLPVLSSAGRLDIWNEVFNQCLQGNAEIILKQSKTAHLHILSNSKLTFILKIEAKIHSIEKCLYMSKKLINHPTPSTFISSFDLVSVRVTWVMVNDLL
jgi:hypothetical protein